VNRLHHRIWKALGEVRDQEYRVTLRFLDDCKKVLDAGCGTGTLLALDPGRFEGIDLNPENVEYCRGRGLTARVGNVLQIPYGDDLFDGVHCSHVMQVFDPEQAVQMLRELGRVVRPGGMVVISTLNWFPRFFRHPENVRPYPPDAIRRLFATRKGSTSPMFPDLPRLEPVGLWLRPPPLLEFSGIRSHRRAQVAAFLNRLQYVFGLRKYWTFDSFIIALRKGTVGS